jgi:hypothetical protein
MQARAGCCASTAAPMNSVGLLAQLAPACFSLRQGAVWRYLVILSVVGFCVLLKSSSNLLYKLRGTAPQLPCLAGLRCLQPALQYIAGELRVDEGMVMPVTASHNTVRMRFDVESTDYLNLYKPDASFPHCHFAMLADEGRLQVWRPVLDCSVVGIS